MYLFKGAETSFGVKYDLALIFKHYGFNPVRLFADGSQGLTYDLNDLSTLFQDSAGTTPVTAAGQPVGRVLDKSGRGNHALQATAASRPILMQSPILGPELVSNGTFDTDTSWTKGAGVSISAGVATCAAGSGYLEQGVNTVAGRVYQVTATAIGNPTYCGAWDSSGQAGALSSTPAGRNGTFTFTFTANDTESFIGFTATGSGAVSLDNISVREITGYYTDRNYLEFDGVDDFLQTNSINFTGTDKMSVFAGVRKLSDAGVGTVCELSANTDLNTGAFSLRAAASALPSYGYRPKGTTLVDAQIGSGYPSPHTSVLTGISNISGDSARLRVNGNQVAQSITDQGSGNYGNYPLYIGRRGGTSLPFKGHLYSLVIVGKLASDSEISNTERYIAQRTGVTLA